MNSKSNQTSLKLSKYMIRQKNSHRMFVTSQDVADEIIAMLCLGLCQAGGTQRTCHRSTTIKTQANKPR